jgi:sugar transferase (PEP-CTERM/EpsH1 system associated)
MTVKRAPLILHVVYKLDFGGLENGLVNIVNRMSRVHYRHAIVCLTGYGEEFRTRLQREDVEVISIGKRPGKDLKAYWKIWKTLRRIQPAVVHTRNLGTVDLQWAAWAAGVRHRVHGEHGWEASDPEGKNRKNLRIRRACRSVIHRYVPMSQDLAQWLRRDVKVPSCRIRQLYSGVDTERFFPIDSASGGSNGSITLGTVGRLDPVKNHEQLLHVFRAIRESVPELRSRLRLLIVGDGPLRRRLKDLALDLGIADEVEFTGARNDTPEQLRRMTVFVLPSVNEGISNTILEAMATGLPVVAGRVGGNPELIQDNVTGCLYDPSDSAALERALLRYLNNPDLRRSHGIAGRERAVRHFGLDAMVKRYLDLYDELLGSDKNVRHNRSV